MAALETGTGAWVMMEIMFCEGTIEEPEQDRGAVHCHLSQQRPRLGNTNS